MSYWSSRFLFLTETRDSNQSNRLNGLPHAVGVFFVRVCAMESMWLNKKKKWLITKRKFFTWTWIDLEEVRKSFCLACLLLLLCVFLTKLKSVHQIARFRSSAFFLFSWVAQRYTFWFFTRTLLSLSLSLTHTHTHTHLLTPPYPTLSLSLFPYKHTHAKKIITRFDKTRLKQI